MPGLDMRVGERVGKRFAVPLEARFRSYVQGLVGERAVVPAAAGG